MRSWAVIISILTFLIVLGIAEINIVNSFCKDFATAIFHSGQKAEEGSISADDIKKVEDIWNKNRTGVFIFSNHNTFSDYEKSLFEMKYYYATNEKEKLCYTINMLGDINKRMHSTVHYNLGNIF